MYPGSDYVLSPQPSFNLGACIIEIRLVPITYRKSNLLIFNLIKENRNCTKTREKTTIERKTREETSSMKMSAFDPLRKHCKNSVASSKALLFEVF